MGNYLSSWTQGSAQSDTQRKYHYKSLENLNMDPEDPDEEMYEEEDDSLPDLPIEVWSGIIVQLSFSDKINLSSVNKMFRELVVMEMMFDLRIFHTKPVVLSLDYEESRSTLMLFTRVQSAITKRILDTDHAGLVFQLEYFRQSKNAECSVKQSQSYSSYWDWWSPRAYTDPHERTVNTCEELEDLANYQHQKYHKLKLVRICLEGQEGLIRGYCQHDYRPIKEYIAYLPPSLRKLEFVTKALHLVSSYQNDLMGNGAIFTAIVKRCPLLDTLHMQFDTVKVSSYYRDCGVLGLDGFSNLTEFKFDGIWNSVSGDEFRAFLSRNSNLAILDLNLDMNEKANDVLLCYSRNLKILRLRCSPGSGPCKRLLNYKWFQIQEGLLYLWIQCDLTKTAEEFLNTLWRLKSLQVLRLDELRGFTEGFFFQILAVLPALEVLELPYGFYPEKEFWLSLLRLEFPVNMREIAFKFFKNPYFLPNPLLVKKLQKKGLNLVFLEAKQ